jgi:hypothetical protein
MCGYTSDELRETGASVVKTNTSIEEANSAHEGESGAASFRSDTSFEQANQFRRV